MHPASARALDVRGILRAVGAAHIDYVLTGSVAAHAYGVPAEPGDVDIAPALDAANLRRIAGLLRSWNAKPQFDPDWPAMREDDCATWTSHPPTAENLDHRFETPHGLFDVVPERSGAYVDLVPRATDARLDGLLVRVAHPCDLIPHLRLQKPKHRERAPHLDALCRRARGGDRLPASLAAVEAPR